MKFQKSDDVAVLRPSTPGRMGHARVLWADVMDEEERTAAPQRVSSMQTPADEPPIESLGPKQSAPQDQCFRCCPWGPCAACFDLVSQLLQDTCDSGKTEQRAQDAFHRLCRRCLICMLLEPSVMLELSWHPVGCWLVQWILQGLEYPWMAAQIAASLRGFVVEAATSPQANHVLQRVIELRLDDAPFIVEELRNKACSLARDSIACRIFCRLVEQMNHASHGACTVLLIDELVMSADQLISHKYGHHVVEKVLHHGLDTHRVAIVTALANNISRHAHKPNGRYVLANVLKRAPLLPEQRVAVAVKLLALGNLAPISADCHGHQVLCAAQRVLDEHQAHRRDILLYNLCTDMKAWPGRANQCIRELCCDASALHIYLFLS